MAKIKIHATSTPFRGDPEGAAEYYEALGRALTLWGRFESHLDFLLWAICKTEAGKRHYPASWPVSMKKKSELWRELFSNVPEMARLVPHAEPLIRDIMDAAQERHVLTHGHFAEFVSSDPLTGKFQRRRHKGKKVIFEKYEITIDQLRQMLQTFDALNNRITPITFAVCINNPVRTPPKVPE